MKQTIAIIDVERKEGAEIAKKLAKANYPLLLFTKDENCGKNLYNEIKKTFPSANVELMGCEFHASWEADIIIIVLQPGGESKVAEKIKEVATRKVVINIVADSTMKNELANLLPNSKLVTIKSDFSNDEIVKIESGDEEAIETVSKILKDTGMRFQLQNLSFVK
jgi:8-hydroxy-5-deazaflavin:NADPH oxidoreductase